MPQLDRVIIFTQIFWLFVILSSSYIILTHFFLPLFIKSLKSRDMVIQSNLDESKNIKEEFLRSQFFINSILGEGLSTIRFFYSKEFLLKNLSKNLLSVSTIDNKIVLFILNMLLYYDYKVLKSIPLKAKVYSSNSTKH
jgi:hypothetical protein